MNNEKLISEYYELQWEQNRQTIIGQVDSRTAQTRRISRMNEISEELNEKGYMLMPFNFILKDLTLNDKLSQIECSRLNFENLKKAMKEIKEKANI